MKNTVVSIYEILLQLTVVKHRYTCPEQNCVRKKWNYD